MDGYIPVPNYSTDPAAALGALEEFRKKLTNRTVVIVFGDNGGQLGMLNHGEAS